MFAGGAVLAQLFPGGVRGGAAAAFAQQAAAPAADPLAAVRAQMGGTPIQTRSWRGATLLSGPGGKRGGADGADGKVMWILFFRRLGRSLRRRWTGLGALR